MKRSMIALLFLSLVNNVFAQKNYMLVKTINVGDSYGWDYIAIDQVNRHVYFSHANKVLIASADKDSIIATIPNTFGVHGIAFDHELNKGFISNGKANSVTVFDLLQLKVLDTVAIPGINPDAILYDKYSKGVFVFNGKSNSATIIDPLSLKIIATISLPGKPEFAATDLRGNIYVNIKDKSELVQLDAIKLTVLKEWPIGPGIEPSGLAIDRKDQLLFSVCSNKKMIVFDILKEKVIDSVMIGGNADAVVFDPITKMIYSSNGEGNVSIIKQVAKDQYQVKQVLITQKGCKTMALDELTKKIYLPAALFEADSKKILPESFKICIYN